MIVVSSPVFLQLLVSSQELSDVLSHCLCVFLED